ncbi:MAG: hypothetical protein J6C04_06455 [Oscillospiraceae bacterium]|nr:hypothetical protein [Oscillospiraceae bacterium]MBQ5314225.1 hypothetical protein [Oscillospiraceae bacterium]
MKKLVYTIAIMLLAFSLTACVTINVVAPEGEAQKEQQTENTQQSTQQEPQVQQPVQTPAGTEAENTESSAEKTQQPQQSYEELEQLYSIWSQLVGYWNAAENRFALVDMMDSHTACFADGMWETEYYRECIVAQLYKDGEQQLWAVINTDGTQENVLIDYSGIEQDGKIRIKIGEDEWRQYMFAGNTMDEAYQTYCDNTYGG